MEKHWQSHFLNVILEWSLFLGPQLCQRTEEFSTATTAQNVRDSSWTHWTQITAQGTQKRNATAEGNIFIRLNGNIWIKYHKILKCVWYKQIFKVTPDKIHNLVQIILYKNINFLLTIPCISIYLFLSFSLVCFLIMCMHPHPNSLQCLTSSLLGKCILSL